MMRIKREMEEGHGFCPSIKPSLSSISLQEAHHPNPQCGWAGATATLKRQTALSWPSTLRPRPTAADAATAYPCNRIIKPRTSRSGYSLLCFPITALNPVFLQFKQEASLLIQPPKLPSYKRKAARPGTLVSDC